MQSFKVEDQIRRSKSSVRHDLRDKKRRITSFPWSLHSHQRAEEIARTKEREEKMMCKAYSKILKHEKAKDFKATKKVLTDLRLAGSTLNAPIIAAALTVYHQSGNSQEAGILLKEFQDLFARKQVQWDCIPPEHVSTILKMLSNSLEWSIALAIVNQLFLCGLAHNPSVAAHAITILAHNNQLSAAQELYQSLPNPNTLVAKSLMKALVANGLSDAALDIFTGMPLRNINQTASSFDIAVRAAEQLNSFERCWSIFQKMKNAPVPLSTSTYNKILSVCASHCNWQSALELLEHMQATDVPANSLSFTRALQSFRNMGKCETARKVFNKIPSSAKDSMIYTAIIELYLLEGSWTCSLDLFQEMGDAKIKQTVQLYVALINALLDADQIDKAKKLVNLMQLNNIQPNEEAYITILKVYSIAGSSQNALNIFKQIQQMHQNRVQDAMPLVLRAKLNAGQSGESLLDLMEQWEQSGVVPSSRSYAVCIEALVREGQGSQALSLFSQLKAMGIEPDSQCIEAASLAQKLCATLQEED